MSGQHLTKSRYLAGLQCPRRLWLVVHDPMPYEPPAPGSPTDIGQQIGRAARLLFPGGALIAEESHAEAAARTAALMRDPAVPAIFEVAFEYDDIRVRVDVMERFSNGTWGLREVKSGGRVKDRYFDDVALQVYVARGAGIAISSVELLHVNTNYVRGSGGIRWSEFFARADVAAAVAARLPGLPARRRAMRDRLGMTDVPDVEPGKQCDRPHSCEFKDRCTAEKPDDWTAWLPHLTAARMNALTALGIEAISAIPEDFPLTSKQAIIRDVAASGKPFVAPDLGRLLRGYGPPACYLDFEAMMPAIPLYEGTRPYQTIPFQWSSHMASEDGTLHHRAFLATGRDDPRRAFAESLIEAVGPFDIPIIVYSPYEKTRLSELAAHFPDLRAPINAIIARLADLLPIVRGAVWFPEFRFSNSIKYVAPALCPGFTYDDLDGIADGLGAAAAFPRLATDSTLPPEDADRLRSALLAYCHRDTMAMVEVHRALLRLAT